MSPDMYENLDVPVTCPECHEKTKMKLVRLKGKKNIPCSNCDAEIDLSSGENWTRIVSYSDACAQCQLYFDKKYPASNV